MKKHYLVMLLVFLLGKSFAQCPGGSISIASTADAEGYSLNYGACTALPGGLAIRNITDLSFLSNVTSINGTLSIEGIPTLTSLAGLEQLTSVSGDLNLFQLGLTNLDAFGNLTTIGGNINIERLESLTTLDGLANLTTLPGYVNIVYNSSLTYCAASIFCEKITNGDNVNFNGNAKGCQNAGQVAIVCNPASCPSGSITLQNQSDVDDYLLFYPNCTSIPGDLIIKNLTDLSFLSHVTSVGGNLVIADMPALTSLNGLQQLTSVGGGLNLTNLGLPNLDDFSNLKTIGTNLNIGQMQALTSLSGLANLTTLPGLIDIVSNPNLTYCAASIVCEKIQNGDYVHFNNNANGCLSKEQVAIICNPVSCPVGGITIQNQTDVDNFVLLYPNCTTISGDLKIFNITDLSFLTHLTTVTGSLIIQNSLGLTSLAGLENLSSIGNELSFYELGLTSLNGLSGLVDIGGHISIEQSAALTTLDGLSSLASVGGIVNINRNSSLSNCNAKAFCERIKSNAQFNLNGNAPGCDFATIKSNCAALPVTLATFTARREGTEVLLSWTTTSELNSERFEVMYSIDGKHWAIAGSVRAEGKESEISNYTFVHRDAQPGQNLYRLKMIDIDQTFAYSKIQTVMLPANPMITFPNPAHDRLYIKVPNASEIKNLTLADQAGRVVFETTESIASGISVDRLKGGLYILTIVFNDGKVVSSRVMVQNAR